MMELIGRGNLERAKYEKQIQVEQAKAELEAAKLRSEAIMLVGEAAKKYPEYRTQEFIGAFAEAIKDGKIDQIIYVPTEAGIPIVESGRVSGGK
jgi:regulator of protease activity HflC (stomatin/prohibitin superfamily)